MRKIILTVFILVWIAAAPALSAVVDGSIWTEMYAYKTRFPQTQSQLRSLDGLRLGMHNAFIPGFSIFARARVATDLSHKLSGDTDLRVFGAYLEYANPGNWLVARAGRQFVFAGLGAITLDGGKIDLTHKRGFAFTGYAGSTPGQSFHDYDEVSSWKKSNAFGGRLKYSGVKDLSFGASFQQRNFKNNLDLRLGGLDISYFQRMWSIFGRADYDLFQKRLSFFTFRPTVRFGQGHYVNLEYFFRRPTLPFHSMFSVFDAKPFSQFRLNPVIKIAPDLYGLGSLTYTSYKGAHNVGLSLGANYIGQSAGFIFSNGYGGKSIGGFANLTYCPSDKLQIYLHGDSFDYKIDKDDSDYNPSLSAALGGNWTVVKNLKTRTEIQLLSNKDYKYDTRFYLRLEYSFRKIVSETTGGNGQ